MEVDKLSISTLKMLESFLIMEGSINCLSLEKQIKKFVKSSQETTDKLLTYFKLIKAETLKWVHSYDARILETQNEYLILQTQVCRMTFLQQWILYSQKTKKHPIRRTNYATNIELRK